MCLEYLIGTASISVFALSHSCLLIYMTNIFWNNAAFENNFVDNYEMNNIF